jgi:uncharacterized protein (DUF427 family)
MLADSRKTRRVLETSHPPVYYIPQQGVEMKYIVPGMGSSFCEWKGRASYLSVVVGDRQAENAAWFYPDPKPGFESI